MSEQQNQIIYYVSNSQIFFAEEEIVIGLTTGNKLFEFAFSPKQAKRFKMLLERNVADYEKEFGNLETELPEIKTETSEERRIGF